MPKEFGPHLLGRLPSPPDPRDFKLEKFLGQDPLDTALALLTASSGVAPATKKWAAVVTEYLKQLPAPSNPKPPAPADNKDVIYTDVRNVLDQGDTGHCVGFGWAQFGNTDPVEDSYVDSDGHAIYYECKVIDGEPGAENGSYVRSGAKAMQNRNRISAYAFASSVKDIRTFIRTYGPVVVGTDWMNDMFTPDANGFLKPTGGVAGGHCYNLVGDLPSEKAFLMLNSWGSSWGDNGHAKITWQDFTKLLKAQGEACATLELALA